MGRPGPAAPLNRDLVIRHLVETGQSAAAAVDMLAPGVGHGEERDRLIGYVSNVRSQLVREGRVRALRPPTTRRPAADSPPPSDAAPDVSTWRPLRTAPPPREEAPSLVDLSPAAAQAALIARLQRTLDEADPGSAAYVAAAKQTQAALDRYHELRRSEEKPARTAADYTPAEWREQLDTSAREMTDPDLEVFVAEWLRRKRLVLRARADGELEIGRAGAA